MGGESKVSISGKDLRRGNLPNLLMLSTSRLLPDLPSARPRSPSARARGVEVPTAESGSGVHDKSTHAALRGFAGRARGLLVHARGVNQRGRDPAREVRGERLGLFPVPIFASAKKNRLVLESPLEAKPLVKIDRGLIEVVDVKAETRHVVE